MNTTTTNAAKNQRIRRFEAYACRFKWKIDIYTEVVDLGRLEYNATIVAHAEKALDKYQAYYKNAMKQLELLKG